MSSDQHIFEGHYTKGKPFVWAKVVIVNLVTGEQTTIQKEFKIDTGFDGGIHVAKVHKSDVDLVGVTPTLGTIGLAGGLHRPAYYCFAYLQQIGDYEFPAPGIEAQLVLQGSSNHGLLGLEILKHFITKFNGPNQLLTIISAISTPEEEQVQS